MKKNRIVWLLCFAIALFGLTACKSSEKPAEPEQIEETTEAETDDMEEQPEETESVEEVAAEADDPATEVESVSVVSNGSEEQVQSSAPAQMQKPEETTVESPSSETAQEPAPQEPQGPADGTYSIAVSFSGGTGKAYVESPTPLYVESGKYYALLTWSSPWYDYMIVNGTKYTPVNSGGNSQFRIPVVLDSYMKVIGDTTAMSVPHEIEYTLYFDSSSIR